MSRAVHSTLSNYYTLYLPCTYTVLCILIRSSDTRVPTPFYRSAVKYQLTAPRRNLVVVRRTSYAYFEQRFSRGPTPERRVRGYGPGYVGLRLLHVSAVTVSAVSYTIQLLRYGHAMDP